MAGNDQFEPATFADWKAGYTGNDNRPKAKQIEDELLTLLAAEEWKSRQEIIAAMKQEGYGENNTDNALQSLGTSGDLERKKNGNAYEYRLKPKSGASS